MLADNFAINAHLSAEDIELIGKELDTIRQEVRDSLGEDDAAYIRKVIDVQRKLELGSRAALLVQSVTDYAIYMLDPDGRDVPMIRSGAPMRIRIWFDAVRPVESNLVAGGRAAGGGQLPRHRDRPRPLVGRAL
mgnify:CR=1 FL=1